MPRKIFIGGNFKMNGTISSTNEYAKMISKVQDNGVEIVVAPTHLHLMELKEGLKNVPHVHIASENCYYKANGAFTGEISAEMLVDAGVHYCIIGHSERRRIMGETNEQSAMKAKAVLDKNITAIFCVGETLDERNSGQTNEVVQGQLLALKHEITEEEWKNVVIAFEPVWAIGTGVTASPEEAQEVHAMIRTWLGSELSAKIAKECRIIYGGSVKPGNTEGLLEKEDIDGFLVGGACMNEEFLSIIEKAGKFVGTK